MKKRLGDILVEMGFIDQGQLDMAIMEAKKTGILLGDAQVEDGLKSLDDRKTETRERPRSPFQPAGRAG